MSQVGKAKLLIVDDVEMNRIILNEILKDTYEIEQAADGMEAISLLLNSIHKPSLILLDVMMPVMDGFQAIKIIRANPQLSKIPVIFITAAEEEQKGLEAGAVDYIMKPFQPEIVRIRVGTQVELFQYREQLEEMVERKANELISTRETFLEAMANLIEYRSIESGQHVMRTKALSGLLAQQLMRAGPYIAEMRQVNYPALLRAVALHDIGKIAIPDDILLKPGRLTPEEFKIIETHTTVGGQVIDSLSANGDRDEYLQLCHDICLYHHERWDGTGYPEKISGTAIPLAARIVALVDVYDALVSERCYKPAFSHEKAAEILVDSSGSHIDPAIVDAFVAVQDQFKHYEESTSSLYKKN